MNAPLKTPSAPTSQRPTIAAFENLDVDPASIDHTAHMFVAWSYLQELDLLTAIERYRFTLQRLTAKLGVPDKFHDTITWFYLVVIAERIQQTPGINWDAFMQDNQDLFAKAPGIIGRYYTDERLKSDPARKQFVLPDKIGSLNGELNAT